MAAGIVILGIDPGTERMGFGAVRAEGSRAAHVASGALVARGRSLAARLRSLEGALAERLSAIAPAAVALEEVFYHHNVRTAVRLGQGQAVALLAAARAGLEVATYAPAQVKLAVTGNGNARKEQVQAMVARILALAELPAPFDAADALAVALCHAHRVRRPRAGLGTPRLPGYDGRPMRDDAANQGTAGPAPCDGAQALVRKARHRADEPELLLEIALHLVAGAHPEEALEVFELGRAAAPERIEFDLGVGASLLQAGEHERARRHIAGHLERHPGSAVGWAHLAVSLHGLGRREEMLAALCKSISLDPSDPQALAFFYQVHEEVGAAEEAQDSLERFAADLAAVGPLLFLARLALRAGERERAAETLDRALEELDREDAAAVAETAGLLLELERVGECIELLEPCSGELEFAPLLCLARAYARADEPELARGLLARLEDLAAGAAQRTQVRAVERELARSAG